MRCPLPPSRSRARCDHPADVVDPGRDRRELLERGARRLPRRSAPASSCRLPAGRRGSATAARSCSIARRSAEPSPSTCSWPTSSSSVRGRSRCGSGASCGRALARRIGEEVAHSSQYAPAVATRRGLLGADSRRATAPSDYERYLNTDALLALQKTAGRVGRTATSSSSRPSHQSSELWLKLAWNDVEAATEHLQAGEIAPALRLLRRATLCLRYATEQLDMLEQMSPWEYQEIRKVLGHGSGFDSPGWRELRRVDARARAGVPRAPRAGGALAHATSTSRGASTRSCTSSPRRSIESTSGSTSGASATTRSSRA